MADRDPSESPNGSEGPTERLEIQPDIQPDIQVNALGLLCPLPILLAARDMRSLSEGQIMAIMGDDAGLLEDVPAWCEKAGHRLLELEDDEGIIFAYVQKGRPTD